MKKKQDVFMVGSKGIPAHYGGFETFVEKLTKYAGQELLFHVACLPEVLKNGVQRKCYRYHDAECTIFPVPRIGPARAVVYDCAALRFYLGYCREHPEVEQPVFYVMACRIGPWIGSYASQIRKLGGRLYVNPDGQEWKRRKWCWLIRRYWKYSERKMIQSADGVICDSRAIQNYIVQEYEKKKPETCFLPYGAEKLEYGNRKMLEQWLTEYQLCSGSYYILVGRFVPENNFDTIIREFMNSHTKRSLVIITGKNTRLQRRIERCTGCRQDHRILFAGTVYDPKLLCMLREHAYASVHGHEVGGTNPSLLEAMLCSDLNLVLDVVYNREVGADAVWYWKKEPGSLQQQIEQAEKLSPQERAIWGERSTARIQSAYSWPEIAGAYERLFGREQHEKNGIC